MQSVEASSKQLSPEVPRVIRVGTRASTLARTQTQWVVDCLRSQGHSVAIETISTRGDDSQNVPIAQVGGDGVFVRELERSLLEHRIDAAVHSLKDLPTAETPGLTLACVPLRASPFDVLVSREHPTLESLPAGAVVGTSSIRRAVQVKALRSDVVVRGIRGNVDTRLRRLDDGEYDCIVLAGAGLERLGLAHRISQVLQPDTFWPAVAQGALVIQIRADDQPLKESLRAIDDLPTHLAVRAERSCLAALAGGCLAPIGAWASQSADGRLKIGACVLEDLGDRVHRIIASAFGPATAPEELGCIVASRLRELGADAMLARMREKGNL
ncbi:MAG: hydroxymethylbilane synthase [Planctomycetota bacterium]